MNIVLEFIKDKGSIKKGYVGEFCEKDADGLIAKGIAME